VQQSHGRASQIHPKGMQEFSACFMMQAQPINTLKTATDASWLSFLCYQEVMLSTSLELRPEMITWLR
jgi:hypothetical protein